MQNPLLTLPRELRQQILLQTFSFTTAPFRVHYKIDVIEELIDQMAARRHWFDIVRAVHPLLLHDILFVVFQWEKEYRILLQEITNAPINSNCEWISRLNTMPLLFVPFDVEYSCYPVRPPVFGWDRSTGRYTVYESNVERWRVAGWTRGTQFRTMRQQQRGRSQPVVSHEIRRLLEFRQHRLTQNINNLPVGGDEVLVDVDGVIAEDVEVVASNHLCTLSRFGSKIKAFFPSGLFRKN